MPSQRPFKLIRFHHDAVCRTCSGDIKTGAFGLWAAGDIAWHSDCAAPHDALNATWTEPENGLEQWCDKKIEENHERWLVKQAERKLAAETSPIPTTPTQPIPESIIGSEILGGILAVIRVPSAYRRYVESELCRIRHECEQDQYERAMEQKGQSARLPRLVPDTEYDANAIGDLIVLAVPPETPVVDLKAERVA